jgi:hypothetical protein
MVNYYYNDDQSKSSKTIKQIKKRKREREKCLLSISNCVCVVVVCEVQRMDVCQA